MGNREFRRVLNALRRMSAQQRVSLERTLGRMRPNAEDVLDWAEACPHCGTEDVIGWGTARGKKRWRCKACGRTFSAVTGTAAEGLRYQEVWPEFAQALMDGATLDEIAARRGIHRTTAHRWRTRFLEGLVALQKGLGGIVEADETYLLRSAKGQPAVRRAMGRAPRRRGGKAVKRGISWEQVPIFMAQDRGGSITCRVSDTFDGDHAKAALSPVLAQDAILCTDGHGAYVAAAREMGIQHEQMVHAAGGRVRGPFHIQNVNGLHSQFKNWLRRFNGVSTDRLPLYVAWFARIERDSRDAESANRVLELMLYA